MSFTLFFKIYAHPPTVRCLLDFTLNPQKCKMCLSKKKVTWVWSKKYNDIKVCMYNKSSFNLPDQWSVFFQHRSNMTALKLISGWGGQSMSLNPRTCE